MFDFPHPRLPNHVQLNRYRAPHNSQTMPYHGSRPPFTPRNQGFHNNRPQQAHQCHDNQEHWCETCDRGFPTEQLLNNHKQQHQKCNIDGCQFVAHPKVITKHIQMQHSSGIFKKIAKLNNPEEIDRWREERRKKYPTKVNIDKKDAELKEKISRGEKMGLGKKEWVKKEFTAHGQKRCYNQPESKPRKPNRRNAAKKPKVLPTPEENRSLLPFPGIQALVMDSEDEEEDNNEDLSSHNWIEDDDLLNTEVKAVQDDKTNDEKPVVCGALSSLMCDYGTSDDEELDDSQEQRTNKKYGVKQQPEKDNPAKNKLLHVHSAQTEVTCNAVPKVMDTVTSGKENKCTHKFLNGVATNSNDIKTENLINKPVTDHLNDSSDTSGINGKKYSEDSGKSDMPSSCINNVENGDDDSGPEEMKVEKNGETGNISTDANKQYKKKVDFVKRKPIYRKPKPKMPSTLIYKLLSKEMKQERNKVLQCVRYIIKHDFFDKTTKIIM